MPLLKYKRVCFALGAALGLLVGVHLLAVAALAQASDGDDEGQTLFSYDDGLPANSVTALWRDDTSLWVGTLAGLGRYTLEGRNAGLDWQTFDSEDGLASDAVSDLWSDDDERLWVSHPDGQISVLEGRAWTTYANHTQTLELAYDEIVEQNVSGPLWELEEGGRVWTLQNGKVGYYVGAVWRPYGEDVGLPRGDLVAVWTGDDGAWVAAESGQIGYFDGASWTTFRDVYNVVQSQYVVITSSYTSGGPLWLVDQDDAVWVRNAFNPSRSPDVRRFAQGRWTNFGSANGMADGFVQELRLDEYGRVWARHIADENGRGGGLSLFDGQQWRAIVPAITGNVTDFWPDGTAGVWISSFFQPADGSAPVGGLTYVALDAWQRFSLAELGGSAVADTWLDERGDFWLGLTSGARNQPGGLLRYQPAQGLELAQWEQRTGLLNGNVRDLWGDGQGGLWVAIDGAVHRIPLRGRRIVTNTLAVNPDRVLGDAEGNVWAVAFGEEQGLWQWNGSLWANLTVSDGLSGGVYADALLSADGRIYLAGERGLDIKEGDEWETFAALPGLHVRQVWQDAAGDVWLTSEITPGRPFNLSLKQGSQWETILKESESRRLGPELLAFLRDSLGRAWMGTALGLFVYEPERSEQWRNLGPLEGLPPGPVPALYEDAGGAMWVAVGEQVYRSDGWDWRRFEPQVGVVERVSAGPEGSVFFAGSTGVALYQPGAPELRLDSVVNLISGEELDGREPVVLTIGRNAAQVNVAVVAATLTEEQLSYRYRLQGWEDWRVVPARALGGKQAFVAYAGLPGGTYTFTMSARNAMLDYGSEVSFPLYVLSRPPQVFLDQASVAGRPVERTGVLQAYVEQPIQFWLSSSDDQVGATTFRYQIEGLGEGWTETSSSEISFTVSAAGVFTFVAVALDGEGQTSSPVGAQIVVRERLPVERGSSLPSGAIAGGLGALSLFFIVIAIMLIARRRRRESW